MKKICLVVLLAGCAPQHQVAYSLCPSGPMPENSVVMAMGQQISDEELEKLNLPKPENRCR